MNEQECWAVVLSSLLGEANMTNENMTDEEITAMLIQCQCELKLIGCYFAEESEDANAGRAGMAAYRMMKLASKLEDEFRERYLKSEEGRR